MKKRGLVIFAILTAGSLFAQEIRPAADTIPSGASLPKVPLFLNGIDVRTGLDPAGIGFRIDINRELTLQEKLRVLPDLSGGYRFYDPDPLSYRSDEFSLSPFGYNFDNRIEGANIFGYSADWSLNDVISFNAAAYVSSGYFGHWVPDRVNNLTFGVGMNINATDRLSFHAWGFKSLKQGIDPDFMPQTGPANGFGVGASYKVTEWMSLNGVYQRTYYNGRSRDQFFVVPGFGYEFKPRKKSLPKLP